MIVIKRSNRIINKYIIDEKKKFIDNNKKAFDELGVAINSVSDAENLLVSGTQSFIKAQIARAKAAIGALNALQTVASNTSLDGSFARLEIFSREITSLSRKPPLMLKFSFLSANF